MKKLCTFLVLSVLLISNSTLYAKGPQGVGGPQMNKEYSGAGIGKEVSSQVKEMGKTKQGTKGETGEWVREMAQNKTRIKIHKEKQKEIRDNKTLNETKQRKI
ncbi:MAG: hypothetical protein ACK4FM_03230 [Caldimicrobium sp.]